MKPFLTRHTGHIIIAVCAIIVGVGFWLAASSASRTAAHSVDTRFVDITTKQCDAGNLIRADRYLQVQRSLPYGAGRTTERERVRRMNAIRDCEATVASNYTPRYLTPDQALEYVRLVDHLRQPIVRGGRVVGSIPMPPGNLPHRYTGARPRS